MKRSLLFRFLFFLFLRLHTPFLSLPYAGVYTLLDNRVQGCLGLLLCSWQPHQPSSLKSHPTFGAELNILPPFGEACVCNPWNHRDPFGFAQFFSTAGGLVVHASTSPTKRLALNTDIGGDAHRRTCTFSNISAWQEAKPRTSFRRLARHDVILSARRSSSSFLGPSSS